MKRLALLPVLVVLVGCSDTTGPMADDSTMEPSFAMGVGGGSTMAALAQHMLDNGRTSGAFFLPPFHEDEAGNLTFTGSGGFLFADFWPSGGLKGVCLFGSTSETNFFRVGPKEYAMDHVNGPAEAGVFARFTEDGTPLPGLGGTGKLNMKIQGTLGEDSFFDELAGVQVTFLYVETPSSAQVWSGVAKVGDEDARPDRHLRCGFTDDAKGNRRSSHFSVK